MPQLDTIVKNLTEAERIRQEVAAKEESIMAAAGALTARQEALAQLRRQQEKISNDSNSADNQVNLRLSRTLRGTPHIWGYGKLNKNLEGLPC